MRLLTHNFLQSNVRGTTNGYPLKIKVKILLIEETNVDQFMVLKMIQPNKINYTVLRNAYLQIINNNNSENTDDSNSTPDDNNNDATIIIKLQLLDTTTDDDNNNQHQQEDIASEITIQNAIKKGILPSTLPETIPVALLENNNDKDHTFDEESILLIQQLHRILFDIHVQEGVLQCPGTNRIFPIKDGIPNMILHEDEI